jgi:hypothetical protein
VYILYIFYIVCIVYIVYIIYKGTFISKKETNCYGEQVIFPYCSECTSIFFPICDDTKWLQIDNKLVILNINVKLKFYYTKIHSLSS